MLPPSLIFLALASSRFILEPAVFGSVRHGENFSQTKATPVAPPLPKSGRTNQIQQLLNKDTTLLLKEVKEILTKIWQPFYCNRMSLSRGCTGPAKS